MKIASHSDEGQAIHSNQTDTQHQPLFHFHFHSFFQPFILVLILILGAFWTRLFCLPFLHSVDSHMFQKSWAPMV